MSKRRRSLRSIFKSECIVFEWFLQKVQKNVFNYWWWINTYILYCLHKRKNLQIVYQFHGLILELGDRHTGSKITTALTAFGNLRGRVLWCPADMREVQSLLQRRFWVILYFRKCLVFLFCNYDWFLTENTLYYVLMCIWINILCIRSKKNIIFQL